MTGNAMPMQGPLSITGVVVRNPGGGRTGWHGGGGWPTHERLDQGDLAAGGGTANPQKGLQRIKYKAQRKGRLLLLTLAGYSRQWPGQGG